MFGIRPKLIHVIIGCSERAASSPFFVIVFPCNTLTWKTIRLDPCDNEVYRVTSIVVDSVDKGTL